MNSKLRKSGGKVLLVPEIKIRYYARAKFSDFWRHNYDNGFWITYPLNYGVVLFRWRHLVPLVFVLGLLGSSGLALLWPFALWILGGIAGMYVLASVAAAAQVAIRERDVRYFLVMPVVFSSLHISYGLGSLWGLAKLAFQPLSKLAWKR